MITVLMLIAIGLMVLGHICKVKRWELYISVYERPVFGNLLEALSFGHVINLLVPVRIGDIFRIAIAGKKLKNGYSFSVATVLTDLYVDLICVGAMFFGLSFIGKGGEQLQHIAHGYTVIFLIVIPVTVLSVLGRKYIKKAISFAAHIFNEEIEFRLLYVSYLTIASIKDIVKRISKRNFAVYTVLMWLGYVFSYVVFAEAVQRAGFQYTTSNVFTILFSGQGIHSVIPESLPIWIMFMIVPLLICLIISFITRRSDQDLKCRAILPQMSSADRLAFLRTYYAEENREHIKSYLEINNDATVVEDNSAGSNASTVVIIKDEKLYFRKYAFDEDGKKLGEQILWIEEHQADIPLPTIVSKKCENNFVSYDMHSYTSAVGLFRYIHTMPAIEGWRILEKALDDIRLGLHSKNTRHSDLDTINKYIESKVDKNLWTIKEKDKYIVRLEEYQEIIVNGNRLRTLGFYKDMLNAEHMVEVFRNDTYSDIHGDLTIENIVCLSNANEIEADEYQGKMKPLDYYFIDPNTGNVHDSPFLDYAKLLQSLHGNYEFLMMVSNININKDTVNYMMTKSEAYSIVYQEYKKYLFANFTREQVISIYYHEIIHWLRLMPYKIRKNEKMAVVFYTGLLQVLADVWEMENEK